MITIWGLFILILTHHATAPNNPVTLLDTHPSDATLFVQGFELHDDELLVGTGLYGESMIGVLDLETGTFTKRATLPDTEFGEGITWTPHGIWQLTWREGTAYLWDTDDFTPIKTVTYSHEGWGIAYDKHTDSVWMSDGSNVLQLRNSLTFELIDTVTVFGGDLDDYSLLNELEFVDGFIYANQWHTYNIIKIDAASGEAVCVFDLKETIYSVDYSDKERSTMNTLNGIAHVTDSVFYVTGKLYPRIYEVELTC